MVNHLDQLVFSASFSGGYVEVAPPAAGGEQEAGGADQNSDHEERETAASQRSAISAFHSHHNLLWYTHTHTHTHSPNNLGKVIFG